MSHNGTIIIISKLEEAILGCKTGLSFCNSAEKHDVGQVTLHRYFNGKPRVSMDTSRNLPVMKKGFSSVFSKAVLHLQFQWIRKI